MGQINIKKTATPSTPDADRMGLYFDAAGNANKVDESGTTSLLTTLTTLESITDVPPYPNDGNDYALVENNEVLTWELFSGGGGGGGTVDSVVGTTNEIDVDSTDAANPVVSLASAVTTSLGLADSALQSGDNVSELTNDAGYLTSAPVPDEEEIVGTATYNGAMTGTVNLDLSTFSSFYGVLTGATTITVTNTPASGESFVRTLKLSSTVTEALTLPVAWKVIGTYSADTTINDFQIEFSNYPTVGALVTCYINQLP